MYAPAVLGDRVRPSVPVVAARRSQCARADRSFELACRTMELQVNSCNVGRLSHAHGGISLKPSKRAETAVHTTADSAAKADETCRCCLGVALPSSTSKPGHLVYVVLTSKYVPFSSTFASSRRTTSRSAWVTAAAAVHAMLPSSRFRLRPAFSMPMPRFMVLRYGWRF